MAIPRLSSLRQSPAQVSEVAIRLLVFLTRDKPRVD